MVYRAFTTAVRCLKQEMMDLYRRSNGKLAELHRSTEPNVASWTAMVAGLVKEELFIDSVLVFQQMQLEGVAPNRVTFMTVLTACNRLESFSHLKAIHGYVMESGLEEDLAIATSLVNIYGRVGSLREASGIFQQMPFKSIIAWTAMLSACVHHNESGQAILLFRFMQCEHRVSNRVTFMTILNACSKPHFLSEGTLIHKTILESGLQDDVPVMTAVVSMYGRCEDVESAKSVFDKMIVRNDITWNAMLTAYAHKGQNSQAFYILRHMDLEGLKPDCVTWLSLLSTLSSLKDGRMIHDRIVGSSCPVDCVLGTALLNMYAKAGSLEAARRIFLHGLSSQSRVSWNTMLGACSHSGMFADILQLSRDMKLEGVMPNEVTLLVCMNACGALGNVSEGQLVLEHMRERGYDLSTNIFATAVVTLYRRCGNLAGARDVFDATKDPDIMLWGSMISGYADTGKMETAFTLFQRMQLTGVPPNQIVVITMLNLCAGNRALDTGETLRALYIDHRWLEKDLVVSNALLDMYGKCGKVEDAYNIFREIHSKDAVSWTSVISAFCENGFGDESLRLFGEMLREGVRAGTITLITLLSSGCQLELHNVKMVHHCMEELGVDDMGATALINGYGKCGDLETARRIFRRMVMHRVVAWNSLISMHEGEDRFTRAYGLFLEMLLHGLPPDRITFISVLNLLLKEVSAVSYSSRKLEMVHVCIVESGLESDLVVGNALINMFGKCCRPDDARRVFNSMHQRSKVSWTAAVSAYAQNQQPSIAKLYFRRMQLEGMKPDRVTFTSVLHTCSTAADLSQGKLLHEMIRESSILNLDPVLRATLVNMYSKCGSLQTGHRIFIEGMQRDDRSILLWTSIISACAQHGNKEEALKLFTRMQQAGVGADDITMTSVLSACTKAGLLERGIQYFVHMSEDYKVEKTVEHFSCMVDLLGRAGLVKDAEELVRKMPFKASARHYMSVLSSCRLQCDLEIGKMAAQTVNELDPGIPAGYVVMSNMISSK